MMMVLIFIFALVLIVSCDNIEDAIDAQIGLSAIELIIKNGYPSEVHTILTKDSYLLDVYRIPHGRDNKKRQNSAPILIYSGLFADSSAYVSCGVNHSLGYILADQGYDVWLGNNRGSTNCKKHIKLDPYKDMETFWNFSFPEMASYDVPDTIDYILDKTNKENLYYIGHSQGTTIIFAMLAEKPLYNMKIRLVTALAPVVSIENIGPPILAVLSKDYSYYLSQLLEYKFYELLPLTENYRKMVKSLCVRTSSVQDACIRLACTFFDCTHEQMNKLYAAVVLSNIPAGASLKQLVHYLQLYKGIFAKYDYGMEMNLNKYGSEMPPVYNLSNIQVPVAIFYAEKDILSTVKNVENLSRKLPNVVFKKLIKNFKHSDLVLGNDAKKYVFTDIITLLEKF